MHFFRQSSSEVSKTAGGEGGEGRQGDFDNVQKGADFFLQDCFPKAGNYHYEHGAAENT